METINNTKSEQQDTTSSNCKAGWTAKEKNKLAVVVFPMLELQEQYGQKRDPMIIMQGWEQKFYGRFSVDQLIYAINEHMEISDNFPSIKSMVEILDPKPPEITQSEFIAAQKYQERNGHPIFSDAIETMRLYRKQESSKRNDHKIKSEKMALLVKNSVNRINHKPHDSMQDK